MVHEELRKYEISVWTLQDSFITVLKWSDLHQKGCIQNPKMRVSNDSIDELTFSIPMYIYQGAERIENPIWYNTQNGTLIEGIRKLKLIINKWTNKEKVYELLITKVSDEHSSDQLMCNVTAQSSVFHELGKIGYKLSLSQTDIEIAQQEDPTVIASIDFWCQKRCGLDLVPPSNLDPNKWYYRVEMNWDIYSNRSNGKIYEEVYPTDWNADLQPTSMSTLREKARIVEIEHSNLYNITQTLAETFQVFVRYEYLYDENYHIIGRVIVFYDTLYNANDNISLTYPNSSNKVIREKDSTDIITKLFVAANNDTESIINAEPNKTQEDYILNFDYLKSIGAITDEQYEAILPHEKKIAAFNKQLYPLELKRDTLNNQKIELEAQKSVYEASIKAAGEQINTNGALLTKIIEEYGEGQLRRDNNHPDSVHIHKDKNGNWYIDMSLLEKGIDASSVLIYRNYNTSTHTFSNSVTGYTFEYDEYNRPSKIFNISPLVQNNKEITQVYLDYKYTPKLYYDSVLNTWKAKEAADLAALNTTNTELTEVNTALDTINTEIDALLDEKNTEIQDFQELMGPALREGYWTPQNIKATGEFKSGEDNLTIGDITGDTKKSFIARWDTLAFKDEQLSYYKFGISEQEIQYPCIDISSIFNNANFKTHLDKIFIGFKNNGVSEDLNLRNIRLLGLGSEVQLAFVNSSGTIKPVLVVLAAKGMSDAEIGWMKTSGFVCRLTEATISQITNVSSNLPQLISSPTWLTGTFSFVYPRVKFSSLLLETDNTAFQLTYNNTLLTKYEDYSILTRNTLRDGIGYPEYYITLKPEVLARAGTTSGKIYSQYKLSNTATATYLDALEVSKENAEPKVSYTVAPIIVNIPMEQALYNYLNRIVMINDVDLKLDNVFGYISSITMDLDDMSKDVIEVKNYKNKFEDIFSSIVAQTEVMKQNSLGIADAIGGNIGLTLSGVASTFEMNSDVIDAYLDEYFDRSTTLQQRLTSLFDEAGTILGDSGRVLGDLSAATLVNANILSGFAQKVAEELTPTVVKSQTQPISNKVGDIWIQTDEQGNVIGKYIATAPADAAGNGCNYTQTYDGTLAAIQGAKLDINTVEGTVELLAANTLTMKSGGTLYIAANEKVDIVGNKAVNIGGTTINIGSTSISGTTYTGGINLVATAYNTNDITQATTSKVLISPTRISMAGSSIEMMTGTSGNTAAIKLNGADGIWIGSNKSITLFAGTDNGTAGSTISLNSSRLYLGTKNDTSAAAIDIQAGHIILAVGTASTITSGNVTLESSNSITGVKITKDSFGIAVGTGTARSVILMGSSGIQVGSGNSAGSSLVTISGHGVYIGGSGTLEVSTNNMIINPYATGSSAIFSLQNTSSTVHLKYDGNHNLTISGANINIGGSGSLSINMTNFLLDTSQTGTSPILRLGTTSDPLLSYSLNGGLQIKGDIRATSFTAYDSNSKALLTVTNTGIKCTGDFNIESGSNFGSEAANTVIRSYSGSITFSLNRLVKLETKPTNLTNYKEGDLVYCTSSSQKGLWKLTNKSNGTWQQLSSADYDSQEVSQLIAQQLAENSFSVTDDGLVICQRLICLDKIVAVGGIYGTIVGTAADAGYQSWSECSCGSGCASTCVGSCGTGCSSDCSGNCSGSCGSGCSDSCGSGCTGGCDYQCTSNCGSGCASGCSGSCSGSCDNTCYTYCTTGCTSECGGDCTIYCTTCTYTCAADCAGACAGSSGSSVPKDDSCLECSNIA